MSEDFPSSPSTSEIMIDIAEIDASRIVFHDPVTSKFKIGGAGGTDMEMTTSAGRYLDDDGNECKLYFAAPTQTTFGPQYVFPFGITEEEDKVPANAKGVQL